MSVKTSGLHPGNENRKETGRDEWEIKVKE